MKIVIVMLILHVIVTRPKQTVANIEMNSIIKHTSKQYIVFVAIIVIVFVVVIVIIVIVFVVVIVNNSTKTTKHTSKQYIELSI